MASSTRSLSGCQRRSTSSAPLRRWASSRVGARVRSPGASLPARSAIGLDLLSGGRDDIPAAAEVLQALARGLARLPVQAEPVERMAPVGDLLASVCASGCSEQRLLRAGTSDGLAVRE